LLYALHAIGRDPKQADIFRPTVTGLLLFGTAIALRRHFPLHYIDYIFIEGTQWVENTDQRYTYANQVRDPLLIAIPKLINMIINDLPKSFHLPDNELQRQDIPLIPTKVIREAVVNALMHRNYRLNSPIQIIRYGDRLEFRNVGYSLKPIEQIDEPVSYPRNPAIASIFHDLNLAEVKGTGGRSIINEMREANLSLPSFESDRERNTFCLTLWTHHLIGQEETQWLTQFKHHSLTNEEARALIIVKQAGKIDNFTYRVATGLDTLAASKSLINLRDKGILIAYGKGRATYYTLASQFPLSITPKVGQLNLPFPEENLGTNSPDKEQPRESNPDNLGSTEQALSPREQYLTAMPSELQAKISNLAKRPKPSVIKDLIVQLCQWRPLSSEAIATILNRNQDYLQSQYLTPLIRDKRLQHTEADPNSPKQSYRAS
jgi:ATP-dependent DNA helicase RecG